MTFTCEDCGAAVRAEDLHLEHFSCGCGSESCPTPESWTTLCPECAQRPGHWAQPCALPVLNYSNYGRYTPLP